MYRRELSIDRVVHWVVLKDNQITLFPCSTFITKTGLFFTVLVVPEVVLFEVGKGI